MSEDVPEAKAGSYADLARRVDRVETNVANLQGTVSEVVLNQRHAEELNRLRFTALDSSVASVGVTLTTFITRMESILSGETQTTVSRAEEQAEEDLLAWRGRVNDFMTQGRLIGTLVKVAVAGNAIALLAGIAAFLK